MDKHNRPLNLKNIGSYFTKAFKFYNLRNELLTRIIFVTILFMSFVLSFIPYQKVLSVILNLISITIIHFASTLYLIAYMKDLKHENYGLNDCLKILFPNFLRIMSGSIVYITTVVSAVISLLIPDNALTTISGSFIFEMIINISVIIIPILLIVINLMFIFNICYIVDKRKNVFQAYKASKSITRGCKRVIFSILLIFGLIVFIPAAFVIIMASASNSTLVIFFVFSFVGAVVNLMQQRLTALLYCDLEYHQVDETE